MEREAVLSPQQVLEHIRQTDRVSEKADFIFNYLTRFLRAYPYPDEARVLLREFEQLSREAGYEKGVGQAYHCYALYYNLKGDHDSELESYSKAIEIYQRGHASSELGNLMVDAANLYKSFYQYEKAISLYKEAIAISEKVNDRFVKARALANYGLLMQYSLQYHESENMLREAIAIAQEHRYDLIYTRASLNLANLFEKTGNVEMMEETVLAVIRHIRKYGDASNARWSLRSVTARMYQLKGDHQRAYRHLRKLFGLKVEGLQHPSVYFHLAEYYREIKEPRKAIWMAQKGIQQAIQIGELYQRARGYQALSSLYASIDDYKNAFFYKLKCEELKNDSSLPEQHRAFYQTISQLKPVAAPAAPQNTRKDKHAQLLRLAFEKEIPGTVAKNLAELTAKELEVLSVLSLGISDKEIAAKLFVSVATVKTHLRNIFSKLLVKNRGEAIRMIYELKLFAEPE